MFEMGFPIPLKIVPKLLNAFRGYRLSFYSLIDLKLSIFVISNRTRNQITRLFIGPQRSHGIFLGTFKIYQLKSAERNAIIHDSRQIDDRYAKLMKEWNDDKLNMEYQFETSEEDFVLNPSSGRLIKKGTRTYNRIFSKRGRGRPKKEDSLVDIEATCYVPIPNAYINPNTKKRDCKMRVLAQTTTFTTFVARQRSR